METSFMLRCLVCCAGLLLWTAPAPAQDGKRPTAWWPEFLGPDRNALSSEKDLNITWDKTPPRVLWKVPLGKGFSSFSIVGDRAYTLCERDGNQFAVCLETAKGKEAWAVKLTGGYLDKQRQGAGARATPTYHDGKLYCLMPMGELFCLNAADGKTIWSADQFKDTGAKNPAGDFYYWGASLSPIVEGDLVIVQPGGNKKNSVAAYHKDSGKLLWSVGDDPPAYGSPIAVTIAGQRQVIVPTGAAVLGIDPAKGTILWRYQIGNQYNATCANPVWKDNLLLMSGAYGIGSAVLEIELKDGRWNANEKWKNKKSLQALFSTPVVSGGHAYGCHGDLGNFMLKCLDMNNGDVKWEERMPCRQFLLGVDGLLLSWSERGTLSLYKMQPQKLVQVGELPDLLTYKCWAAPALADGRLFLRDEKNALCLDLRR
jgi:outer membrane protein assembly factor BamB